MPRRSGAFTSWLCPRHASASQSAGQAESGLSSGKDSSVTAGHSHRLTSDGKADARCDKLLRSLNTKGAYGGTPVQ